MSCCAAGLVSCASVERNEDVSYPKEWSSLSLQQRGDGCPNVSGVYEDVAERRTTGGNARMAGYHVSLAAIVFSVVSPDFLHSFDAGKASKVSFKMATPDSILIQVTVDQPGDQMREYILRKLDGAYDCDGSYLVMRGRHLTSGIEGAIMVDTDTLYIAKADDGALVIKRRIVRAGVGFVFLIPWPERHTFNSWFRFLPADVEPAH